MMSSKALDNSECLLHAREWLGWFLMILVDCLDSSEGLRHCRRICSKCSRWFWVPVKSWQLSTFLRRWKSQPIRIIGGNLKEAAGLVTFVHGVTRPLWYVHGMWRVALGRILVISQFTLTAEGKTLDTFMPQIPKFSDTGPPKVSSNTHICICGHRFDNFGASNTQISRHHPPGAGAYTFPKIPTPASLCTNNRILVTFGNLMPFRSFCSDSPISWRELCSSDIR